MQARWLAMHALLLAQTRSVTSSSHVTEHDLKASLLVGYNGAVRPARWAADAAHSGVVAGQRVVAARRLLDVNNDGVVNKDDLMHVAGKTSWLWRTSVRNCQRIDQICRLIFPPLYIFFVLVMGSTLVKDSYRE